VTVRARDAASPSALGGGNDKAPAGRVTGVTSCFSIAEVLDEEVNAWIAREQAANPSLTRPVLLDALARELDLADARARQLYRYMSGDTPFPAEKIIRTCRRLGSWKLLEFLDHEAARAQRDLGPMVGFDLIIGQARTVKEFGDLVSLHADAMDRPLTPEVARAIEREGREAILQIERLIANAQRLVGRRPGDVR
jgi:hypothetical protein